MENFATPDIRLKETRAGDPHCMCSGIECLKETSAGLVIRAVHIIWAASLDPGSTYMGRKPTILTSTLLDHATGKEPVC